MSRSQLRLRPCGDAAFLVELDDLDSVLGLVAALDAVRDETAWASVLDVVPAARTVLVRCRPGTALTALARAVRALTPLENLTSLGNLAPDGEQVRIPVWYDGPDLDEVGRLTGLGTRGVIERHQATDWRVAFTGFAPGFGYLVGGDGTLEVPRRAESRPRVPAGAVGLAGEFTGVYPRSSPGGWQLIGHTELQIWDPSRDPAALLRPGTRVRFEAVAR